MDVHWRRVCSLLFHVEQVVRTRFSLCRDLTLEQQFARGIFPVLKGNAAKFPEGESLDDLGLFVSLFLFLTFSPLIVML